jgi:hypothetical protein
MIKVLNERLGGEGVYIGRGSALGNPFVIGRDGTRNEVVAKFRVYLLERIATKDKAICGQLNDIWKKAKEGDVALVCFCAPQRCHGDVIKAIVEGKL